MKWKTCKYFYLLYELFTLKNYWYKLFEIIIADKVYKFIGLYIYMSPSQSQDKYESFKENLKLNTEPGVQNNPFLVVILSNFHARSSKTWAMEFIQSGLHQVINELTHIFGSSTSHVLIC